MAPRTKEDALAAWRSLVDAAELLFQAQGVSRTTLNDIARKTGTKCGAIYWHFKDKADLFNAMMERVTLPLEQAFEYQYPSARIGISTTLGQLSALGRPSLHVETPPCPQ